MAKSSESGHTKNVTNFESLLIYVKGFAEIYNPSREALQVVALEGLLTKAQKALIDVDSQLPAYTIAVSNRETAFKPLGKIITKINNYVKSTDTTANLDESVRTLVRKLQGTRATAKISDDEKQKMAAEGKEVNQISSSQMGYETRLENFYKLILLVESIPQYSPNEEEIKVASLKALYNRLKNFNTEVLNTSIPLSNARIARDAVLYTPLTGMVDLASDTKTYIKSLFGTTSPQYKQVTSLEFKSLVK